MKRVMWYNRIAGFVKTVEKKVIIFKCIQLTRRYFMNHIAGKTRDQIHLQPSTKKEATLDMH